MSQSIDWAFTIQLSQDPFTALLLWEAFHECMQAAFDGGDITCIRAQPEQAPSGQYHVQGYLVFPGRKAMTTVRRFFEKAWMADNEEAKTPHLEVPKGTPAQNEEYCLGGGPEGFCFKDLTTQLNLGDLPEPKRPGKRTDLLEAKAAIEEGVSELEFAQRFFGTWARMPKVYNKYRQLMAYDRRDQNEDPEVMVFYGITGSGKTREAVKMAEAMGEPYYLRKGVTGEFFSGYMGEKMCVLDEFDHEAVKINTLKDWLDRYPTQVAGKLEGHVQLQVNKWIITSQCHPNTWYPNARPADRAAIIRRITLIKEFKMPEDSKFGTSAEMEVDYDALINDMVAERTATEIPALPERYQMSQSGMAAGDPHGMGPNLPWDEVHEPVLQIVLKP